MKKMIKARGALVLDAPFFASLALKFPLVADKTCETLYVDGLKIGYNPDFIESLSLDEAKAVICHEILHVGNLHHTRRDGRNVRLWNQACDYAINGILMDGGYRLPDGALRRKDLDGKSAEEIYNIIKSESNNPDKQKGNDPGGCGEVRDFPGDNDKPTPSDIAKQEQQIKVAMTQAIQIAKKQGEMPGGMERVLSDLLDPKIPWKEVLSRWMTEVVRNDYTWKTPNKRYAYSGLYLPALQSEALGKVVVYMDTSGSVSVSDMNVLATEVQSILHTFPGIDIEVIYVDTKVQNVQSFSGYDDIELRPRGGGGTDFRPGFEYVEEHALQPAGAVYLTDGYCNRFPDEPEYPVLWALNHKYEQFKPPFGEVITI